MQGIQAETGSHVTAPSANLAVSDILYGHPPYSKKGTVFGRARQIVRTLSGGFRAHFCPISFSGAPDSPRQPNHRLPGSIICRLPNQPTREVACGLRLVI